MAATPDVSVTDPPRAAPDAVAGAIREIGFGDLSAALREGWADFLEKPSHNILFVLLYPLATVLIVFVVSGNAALPLLYPLVMGFALIGPILALPIMEISRRRERGDAPTWGDALAALRPPAGTAALAIALALLAVFALWLVVARALHGLIIGPDAPESFGAFWAQVTGSTAGWALIAVGNLVGLGFAVAAMAMGVFSLPRALDGERSAPRAIVASVRAVRRNPGPMALWGAIVGAVLAGTLALGVVGVAVALPVFAHATWRLYRRTFPQRPPGAPGP